MEVNRKWVNLKVEFYLKVFILVLVVESIMFVFCKVNILFVIMFGMLLMVCFNL